LGLEWGRKGEGVFPIKRNWGPAVKRSPTRGRKRGRGPGRGNIKRPKTLMTLQARIKDTGKDGDGTCFIPWYYKR